VLHSGADSLHDAARFVTHDALEAVSCRQLHGLAFNHGVLPIVDVATAEPDSCNADKHLAWPRLCYRPLHESQILHAMQHGGDGLHYNNVLFSEGRV
jgi:hypothetical protein